MVIYSAARHLRRYIQIYFLIFWGFVPYTLLFSIPALIIYLRIGWSGLPFIFWTKIVGYASVGLLYHFTKSGQLLFFHNLGLSVVQLAGIVIISDMALLVLALQFINPITT